MLKTKLIVAVLITSILTAGSLNIRSVSAEMTTQPTISQANIELIKKLQALLLELQQQLLALQKNEAELKDKKSTNKSAESFLYVENIESKQSASKSGLLKATAGDRIEFTWEAQNMKECNFTVNDGSNNSLVKNNGYKLIVAPEKKGTYDYAVGCTDTKGTYHYTKISLNVTTESNSVPSIVLEIQNHTKKTSLTTKDMTVNPGDKIAIRWNANGFDSCELRHSSYAEIISYNTTGYLTEFVSAGPGVTAIISLDCEKDVDGPDLSARKTLFITTSDPDGVAGQKG